MKSIDINHSSVQEAQVLTLWKRSPYKKSCRDCAAVDFRDTRWSGSSRKSDRNVGTQVITPEQSHPPEQEVSCRARAHDRSRARAHNRGWARARVWDRVKKHDSSLLAPVDDSAPVLWLGCRRYDRTSCCCRFTACRESPLLRNRDRTYCKDFFFRVLEPVPPAQSHINTNPFASNLIPPVSTNFDLHIRFLKRSEPSTCLNCLLTGCGDPRASNSTRDPIPGLLRDWIQIFETPTHWVVT